MTATFTPQFDNNYTRLPPDFYARVTPAPLRNSHLIHFNNNAAKLIDFNHTSEDKSAFINALKGENLLPGMQPIATVYAGHQFGTYVPQLGDGRAMLLGQVRNKTGELWDLQLKGAGVTPYSRNGDGRAVLRSTIREYLCSEAMHALGIPTTRALCMFGSDEPVYRESIESGALLVRMAPSHVRFGSFEYFYYNNQHHHIQDLADHVIEEYYPQLQDSENKYYQLLEQVILKTAKLIAQWQAVGFAHGVMNTDNMSILGLTIDYGPYGFLDSYDPDFICNHSDHQGRYAFNQQPSIGLFNLSCLAQALLPLLAEEAEEAVNQAKDLLSKYEPQFVHYYAKLSRQKLGLLKEFKQDQKLHAALLKLLDSNNVDYTRLFRALSGFSTDKAAINHGLRDMFVNRDAFDHWAQQYRKRLLAEVNDDSARKLTMNQVNPKYILRNYLAENAIRKATDEKDYTEIDRLIQVLSNPFDEQPQFESYAAEPPDWAQHIEVSCSS